MSDEAAKLLRDKADQLTEVAKRQYESTVSKAEEQRLVLDTRASILRAAAREVCEHLTLNYTTRKRRCGTHGRDEEEYVVVSCKVCAEPIRYE